MNKKGMKSVIEKISASLSEISVRQIEWSIEQHQKYILENKDKFVKTGRRSFKNDMLFSSLQYCGDWQIQRVFVSSLWLTNRQTRFELDEFEEVSQFFLNVKTNEQYFMQRPLKFMGKGWDTFKPMRFRTFSNPYSNTAYYASMYGDKVVNSTLHPIVRRNGLTMDKVTYFDKHNYDLRRILVDVVKDPFYETLIKSDQWEMAKVVFKSDVHKKAMLLNLRFGIDMTSISEIDLNLWFDAISLMDEVGIDWHNPKILVDWRHQHDVAVRKKEKINEIKELEKIKLMEGEFAKSHKKYLDIDFEEDGLRFHSLSSVKEYYEEGKKMHHCVYAMGYYRQKNKVIFSIRNEQNERLATLEYDLESKSIVQCRAVCNAVPERYDDMLEIFNDNVWRLKKSRKKKMYIAA